MTEVGPGDAAAEGALAEGQAVDDRRIGLETHALFEAVDEHAGDARPLVSFARLLLDDRRQGDHFARRPDRQIRHPLLPHFLDALCLSPRHCRQQRLAAIAALKRVSVGHKGSLAGSLLDVPSQHLVFAQPLNDLLARQALRDRQLVHDDPMGDELILDVVHAHARLERIFPALQRAAIAVKQGQNVEP